MWWWVWQQGRPELSVVHEEIFSEGRGAKWVVEKRRDGDIVAVAGTPMMASLQAEELGYTQLASMIAEWE